MSNIKFSFRLRAGSIEGALPEVSTYHAKPRSEEQEVKQIPGFTKVAPAIGTVVAYECITRHTDTGTPYVSFAITISSDPEAVEAQGYEPYLQTLYTLCSESLWQTVVYRYPDGNMTIGSREQTNFIKKDGQPRPYFDMFEQIGA
jgi:hypothetical protein